MTRAASSTPAFFKLEALANDFVLIDARRANAQIEPAQVRALADRRTGIGFDQLLVLRPGDPETVSKVEIFNADGSGAEQCGNGMRAIAAWLDRNGELSADCRVRTPAGEVALDRAGDGRFAADLPEPAPLNPATLDLPPPSLPAAARTWQLVSTGNPHLIVHWPAPVTPDTLAEVVAAVEQQAAWRQKTNIGLLHLASADSAELQVHERGAGPTRACGSAACAAAWVARSQHPGDAPVSVRQPGGVLVVDLHRLEGRVLTVGPARVVFEGRMA